MPDPPADLMQNTLDYLPNMIAASLDVVHPWTDCCSESAAPAPAQ